MSVCEIPQCIRLCGLCECEYVVPATHANAYGGLFEGETVCQCEWCMRFDLCVCMVCVIVECRCCLCGMSGVHEGLPGQGQSQGHLTVTYEVPLC